MGQKISDYTASGSIADDDLLDVSVDAGGGTYTTKSILFSVLKSAIPSDNISTADLTATANRLYDLGGFKQGITNGELGIGTASPDDSAQLDVTSTDKGLLIPRHTTAQMNAISTPKDDLLVFNTDLEALYRYDGSNWVALSAGYGIIAVYDEDDSGIPTYYASISSALDQCKTSGKYFTVKLYSNVEATSTLYIRDLESFLCKSITIDLNGFMIYGDMADATSLLEITLDADKRVSITNGYLVRNNSTGGRVLRVGNNHEGAFSMSNCVIYNAGSGLAGEFDIPAPVGAVYNEPINLGGSVFIAESDIGVTINEGRISSFHAITKSGVASYGVYLKNSTCEAYNFTSYAEAAAAVLNQGGRAERFRAESNSGKGVQSSGYCNLFTALSQSNDALDSDAGGYASNFEAYSESSFAIDANGASTIINGTAISNSGTYTVQTQNNAYMEKVTCINLSGTYAGYLFTDSKVVDCSFISNTGASALVYDDVKIIKCYFHCKWNNASGHCISLGGGAGTIANLYISLSKFDVTNASANCIFDNVANTINAVNNVYGSTAITPVNANVIITSTSISDAYGNIQE